MAVLLSLGFAIKQNRQVASPVAKAVLDRECNAVQRGPNHKQARHDPHVGDSNNVVRACTNERIVVWCQGIILEYPFGGLAK